MKKKGFNWARDIHKIQESINNTPKEVIGHFTPLEVVRGNENIAQNVKRATERCLRRTLKSKSKQRKYGTSIYNVGENVLFRYPGKDRVPKNDISLEERCLRET